jgi:fluoroquinolone transport system ATP-binding protein
MMIDVQNLTFTYQHGKHQTLKGLNFQVGEGEIFGFLGPSGAGKSTTQKILIGLLKGYQGNATVMGKAVQAWKSDYYEHIGVGFELPNHYLKLTALENLNYFRSLYTTETEAPHTLLDMVGLSEDGNTRVAKFSKGMKMRLNFVRALLHRPALIFLDEPTAGLDPVNARLIKEIILQQKAAGKTIFLTTHDMTTADQLCDRVAFIVDGAIKLIDAPRALKIRYGERKVRVEYSLNSHVEHQDFPLEYLGSNEQFLQVLRQNTIQTIHTRETTLESIFIQITGRSLQ